MTLIAPSILSADFSNLEDQIKQVEQGGADWLHLDVMDGHFVPNISFGPPLIRSIRKATRLPFDAHLMIEDPDSFLESFREAGADIITVHYEVCRHLHRTVHRIRELGARPGVSINPATPVEILEDIVADVDLILIMSVNPGFGGQTFIPASLGRIRRAATLIRERKPDVVLEVDGGVDTKTAGPIASAGATMLVAGSHIFGAKDIAGAVRQLRERANHR